MRLLPPIVALACLGCSGGPSPEERALISKVESLVSLPKGAGRLQCYARHYALLEGKELADWLDNTKLGGRKALIGLYMVVDERSKYKPGVYWSNSVKDLPEVFDGGCSELGIFYMVGEDKGRIPATCSTTVFGDWPQEVEPPITC